MTEGTNKPLASAPVDCIIMRLDAANEFIESIASHGGRFFEYVHDDGRQVAHFKRATGAISFSGTSGDDSGSMSAGTERGKDFTTEERCIRWLASWWSTSKLASNCVAVGLTANTGDTVTKWIPLLKRESGLV
jgi:hypothetical protein